jgi:hypothetical protein
VDLKTVFLAILWHDCWRAAKDAKRPLSLALLTLYEGIGASRYFAKAARAANIDPVLRRKISYCIKKHSRFQVLPIKIMEARILRIVDALDMFNPARTHLLKQRFLFDQPISLSSYRAGVLVLRLFCVRDPKGIQEFEWSQKISTLRASYAAYGRHALADYKMLCDLLRQGQLTEFERLLDELRQKYFERPEHSPEALCAFDAMTTEHS